VHKNRGPGGELPQGKGKNISTYFSRWKKKFKSFFSRPKRRKQEESQSHWDERPRCAEESRYGPFLGQKMPAQQKRREESSL